MAQVLGESGRYVSHEAVRTFRRMLILVVVAIASLAAIWGFLMGLLFPVLRLSSWRVGVLSLVFVLAMVLVAKLADRKFDAEEQQRMKMRKGATGEAVVALVLGDLPEEYHVINDLTTRFGNLDHVVVGPTGVFVLDAKNWRGVVSAAGNGELLLNQNPTDKPHVKQFVGRIMGIKDRVKALAPGLDPYFQAVFVFPSARVEAGWGATGKVHCIRDEQLHDYIVESKRGTKLTKEQVETIAQAFLGLAHMDPGFTAKAEPAERPRVSAIVARPYVRANSSFVQLKLGLNPPRS